MELNSTTVMVERKPYMLEFFSYETLGMSPEMTQCSERGINMTQNYCGIILAGGKGTRMGELTKVTNKHLLPVGTEPMIYHPLKKLVGAGIEDIMVVTGTEHMGAYVNLLGSGKDHNCQLTYRVQDEAGGIAQALGLARHFCCGEGRPVVLLGDNIFEDSLSTLLTIMAPRIDRAMVVLKQVPDPKRFGLAYLGYIDKKQKILSIVEKPTEILEGTAPLAITGIYIYPHNVFDVISNIKPSNRGELEITDVNAFYLRENLLDFYILPGYWTDAGTLDSWHTANTLVRERKPQF